MYWDTDIGTSDNSTLELHCCNTSVVFNPFPWVFVSGFFFFFFSLAFLKVPADTRINVCHKKSLGLQHQRWPTVPAPKSSTSTIHQRVLSYLGRNHKIKEETLEVLWISQNATCACLHVPLCDSWEEFGSVVLATFKWLPAAVGLLFILLFSQTLGQRVHTVLVNWPKWGT